MNIIYRFIFIICKIIIILYDLNKKGIKDKKILKKIFSIIRAFIKKLLKKLKKNWFILIVLALKIFIKKLLKKSRKTLNINNFIL